MPMCGGRSCARSRRPAARAGSSKGFDGTRGGRASSVMMKAGCGCTRAHTPRCTLAPPSDVVPQGIQLPQLWIDKVQIICYTAFSSLLAPQGCPVVPLGATDCAAARSLATPPSSPPAASCTAHASVIVAVAAIHRIDAGTSVLYSIVMVLVIGVDPIAREKLRQAVYHDASCAHLGTSFDKLRLKLGIGPLAEPLHVLLKLRPLAHVTLSELGEPRRHLSFDVAREHVCLEALGKGALAKADVQPAVQGELLVHGLQCVQLEMSLGHLPRGTERMAFGVLQQHASVGRQCACHAHPRRHHRSHVQCHRRETE
mmetsp:Transcript_11392/g.47720  ORF Transcript_11392/g.47720 Transcript_11392/m.47720 type:complete len:313 (+) Transcript_11392:779-1717(+)